MLGFFSKEALEKFQAMHGLESGQDFSEGVFDFKVCQKPDGARYGIPDDATCGSPSKEVKDDLKNSNTGDTDNYKELRKKLLSKPSNAQTYKKSLRLYEAYFENNLNIPIEDSFQRAKLAADNNLFLNFGVISKDRFERVADMLEDKKTSIEDCEIFLEKVVKGD